MVIFNNNIRHYEAGVAPKSRPLGPLPASLQAASFTAMILMALQNVQTYMYKSQIQNKNLESYIKNIPKLQLCRTFEILVLCSKHSRYMVN